MSVRVRVAMLRAAFMAVVVAMLWMAVLQAQRTDVSPAVRLAISEASRQSADELARLRTEVAVVQKTAQDIKDEAAELRRAIWAMAVAVGTSLLTQIRQAKKTRGDA